MTLVFDWCCATRWDLHSSGVVLQRCDLLHSFFYKNLFYKNVKAEICPDFKNIPQAESRRTTLFCPFVLFCKMSSINKCKTGVQQECF